MGDSTLQHVGRLGACYDRPHRHGRPGLQLGIKPIRGFSGRLRHACRLFSLVFSSCSLLCALLAGRAAAEVTLVLGGGGAAGVAHVGVIAELERNGLRPDCIVGTSMGALVGGLYAAGYSPSDLEGIAADIDWDSVLSKSVDRAALHPLRRESRLDGFDAQGRLPLGIGEGGAIVSGGLFDDVQLGLILRDLTAPVGGIVDFDSLPIPFRAVAADLRTGQAVVLGDGDLATALRASMSIPGLFAPVEVDGRLLVDGGIAENLPIDVGRTMCGGDLVVSFIPPAEMDEKNLRELTGALAQTLSLFIHRRSREQIETLRMTDLLITPAVESIGVLDFKSTDAAIEAGRVAAAAASGRIRELARNRPPLSPAVKTPMKPLAYDRLVIENDSSTDVRVIRARLDLPDKGVVSPATLQERLLRLYGLDVFSRVTYETRRQDDETVLVVKTAGRDTGAVEVRAGLVIRGQSGRQGNLSFLFGASYVGLDSLGARLDFDGSIGASNSARLQFEQPLDYGQEFFFKPSLGYLSQTTSSKVSPSDTFGEFTVNQVSAPVDLLWAPGAWGRVGISFGVAAQQVQLDLGSAAPGLDESWEVRPVIGPLLEIDTLDNLELPLSGEQLSFRVAIDPTGPGDGNYGWGLAEASAIAVRSFGLNTVSVFGSLQGEVDAAGFSPSFLGGFQRLSGYNRLAIADNVAALSGIRYYRRINLEVPFAEVAFAGGSLELGGVFNDWGEIGWPGAEVHGSVFAGFVTPLGPLIFAGGFGEGGETALHLTLGQRF